ncbi:MAG: PadR family transcriptional regulator [Actinobacteria bacterium]|uniref:Transcriptional regulator, PadR family n=1 Tax=hydrothermal vent metagenome TaxID=652676 RepID=A0A3B0SG98_9ZZZZ|nr:PadR family transcriptional regulator [Actinomycetota bacterium]
MGQILLDLAVLGLLRDTPLHGYELKRRLADLGFWRVSFGSLYPGLKRLERQGFIESLRDGGRKRTYQLVPAGQAHFEHLLIEETNTTEDERHFHLRLAFFRYLDGDTRIKSLDRRRNELVERLADSRRSMRLANGRGRERPDRYAKALMERGVRSTESDIAWLDQLIAAERSEQASPSSAEQSQGETQWAK